MRIACRDPGLREGVRSLGLHPEAINPPGPKQLLASCKSVSLGPQDPWIRPRTMLDRFRLFAAANPHTSARCHPPAFADIFEHDVAVYVWSGLPGGRRAVAGRAGWSGVAARLERGR
eukprot:236-Chlamydomonas_euryale.AAC.1